MKIWPHEMEPTIAQSIFDGHEPVNRVVFERPSTMDLPTSAAKSHNNAPMKLLTVAFFALKN